MSANIHQVFVVGISQHRARALQILQCAPMYLVEYCQLVVQTML